MKVTGLLLIRRAFGRMAVASFIGLLFLTHDLQAADAPGKDKLVQAPELAPPGRGSLAGSLAGKQWGPGDVSRGTLTLPFPGAIPEGRGPLLVGILPSYAPEQGLSEWGLGWGNNLAITRLRAVGEVQFDETDALTSPWGRLSRGDDGAWYPAGLKQFVRVTSDGLDWQAVTSDGTRFRFSHDVAVRGPRGILAWYVTRVEDLAGHHTELAYDQGEAGRPYLTSVSYGGRKGVYTQRLALLYESLTIPTTRYDAGALVKLDRRVRRLSVESLHTQTGAWQERFHFALTYTQDSVGPAFFLQRVTKTYASGDSEPSVVFEHALWSAGLAGAAVRPSPKLQAYFEMAREHTWGGTLDPRRVTFFDADEDGRTDVENSYEHLLVRQTDDGWVREPLLAREATASPRCRPSFGPINAARHLSRLIPGDTETHVLVSTYENMRQSRLTVCSRAGAVLHERVVDGVWTLGPTRRLVDINRDQAPDIVWIGRGQYRILVNKSTAGRFEFGDVRIGTLKPAIEPDAAWVQDVNGDGIADLVSLMSSGLFVWYGKGNFTFEEQAAFIQLKGPSGAFSMRASDELYFVDANHDGMTDLLVLFDGRRPLLFINRGDAFALHAAPVLNEMSSAALGGIAFGDFSGSGDVEVAASLKGRAHALSLDTPQTSLLTAVDDGKGTRWRLGYERALAQPGIRYRPSVLAFVHVESSGQEPTETRFAYHNAVTQSKTHLLVGFERVSMQRGRLHEDAVYYNDDDTSGLALQTARYDHETPQIVQAVAIGYDTASYQGLPYQRQVSVQNSLRDANSGESMDSRDVVTQWTNPWCASETSHQTKQGTWARRLSMATVSALADVPHCMVAQETQTGSHPNPSLDFSYSVEITHDDLGSVTEVRLPGSTPVVLQRLTYDSSARITRIDMPGAGASHLVYDDQTGQLAEIIAPDGVRTAAAARDPLSDALLALVSDRGAGKEHQQGFAFDGLERLQARWDSAGVTDPTHPLETLRYRYATGEAPGLVQSQLRITDQSFRDTWSIFTGDGVALTTASRTPEGWALAGFSRAWPSQARSVSYGSRALKGDAGMVAQLRSFDVLYDDAAQIGTTQSDALGRVSAESHLAQHDKQSVHTHAYEVRAGELHVTVRDSQGRVVRRVMAADGQPVSVTDGGGRITTFAFDVAGRLRRTTLPDSTHHDVDYDAFGRVATVLHGGVVGLAYVYEAGTERLLRIEMTDKQGRSTRALRYSYDALGRKTEEAHAFANSADEQRFTFYYDGHHPDGTRTEGQRGFLTGVAGEGFQKYFTYRPDGKLQRQRFVLTGWRSIEKELIYFADSSPRGSITRVSNTAGELARLQTASELDAFGRFARYVVNGTPLYTVHYDDHSAVAAATMGEKFSIAFARDPMTRRLNGVAADAKVWPHEATLSWERDNADNIAQEQLAFGPTQEERRYTYDARSFLQSWGASGTKHVFDYDDNGVRVSRGTEPLVWDDEGRLSRRGGKTFGYNAAGQVATVRGHGRQVDYLYDEAGQRILKRVDGVPVLAFVDGDVLDADHHIRPVEVSGWRIGMLTDGRFSPVFADGRGTTLVNGSGRLSWPEPFGVRVDVGSDHAGWEYAQKAYDSDTGTIRMGLRDYDPTLGRFTTPDPLYFLQPALCGSDPLQCNLFVYALNSPLGYVDPDGLAASDWADRWDDTARTATNVLDRLVTDNSSASARWGANYLRSCITLTRGYADTLRFGEGLASGTWSGALHDGFRAVSIVGTVAGPLLKAGSALAAEGRAAYLLGRAPRAGAAAEKSFFEGTNYTSKVLNQMQGGAGEFHSFPESVRAFESAGSVRSITGGDGIVREILEIPGSYSGRDGLFQFIKNQDATINHRLFVPNKP